MVDDTTFAREVQSLLAMLYRISFSIVRSDADAQDAVQQAMMKAWQSRGRAQEDKFRAWVTRIVINESRNIQRHRMRVTPREIIEPSGTAFQSPNPDVMDAVYDLPEKLRVPFLLKYLACYKEREIADALRLPASTIKSRLSRARALLRDALNDREVSFE